MFSVLFNLLNNKKNILLHVIVHFLVHPYILLNSCVIVVMPNAIEILRIDE